MSVLRQILVLCVLCALAYGGYVAWDRYQASLAAAAPEAGAQGQARGPSRPTSVVTAAAYTRDMETAVEAVGTTLARHSVAIVADAEGRVAELAFETGQRIDKGAVMVTLQSEIEQADLAQARASLLKAEAVLKRARTLNRSRIAATATVDDAEAEFAAARAAVERAEARLADRVVRAPFAGTVGMRRIDAGSRITDQTVITTLDDLSSVLVEFSVAEELFSRVRMGQAVEAGTEAYPGRKFDASVVEIDSRVDPVSRSFKVRAQIPNLDGALPAGLFMHLRMILETAEATVVPEEAVVAEAGATFVFLVRDGKAERRPVELGRRSYGVAEIRSGLEPGDIVVTEGTSKLRNGAAVKPVTKAAEASQ